MARNQLLGGRLTGRDHIAGDDMTGFFRTTFDDTASSVESLRQRSTDRGFSSYIPEMDSPRAETGTTGETQRSERR